MYLDFSAPANVFHLGGQVKLQTHFKTNYPYYYNLLLLLNYYYYCWVVFTVPTVTTQSLINRKITYSWAFLMA